jgi:hypothetical protein
MSEWKKFTGSSEQISEILNAKNGVRYRKCDGKIWQANSAESLQSLINYTKHQIEEYLICQPHPHAEMIIEWARTGREVYWYNGCGQWVIDDSPVWSPDMKYSFNPHGNSK